MKRLIPAGVLLCFVIAVYLFSFNYINKSCNKTLNLLNETTETYKTGETAEKSAKKLKKYWDKEEIVLSLFINHNHIDDIEKAISSLNVYAKEKNNVIFYEYADEIKILLHQIIEDSKIGAHSIF